MVLVFYFVFFLSLIPNASADQGQVPTSNVTPVSEQAPTSPFLPGLQHDFGDNNPDVYLCLGDSITYGYGLLDLSQSYPAQLQALLGKTVINEGISGTRSSFGAIRVNRLLDNNKPGYLLTLYGVNDIGERRNDAIVESLRQIIHAAKANKTTSVVATLTPVFHGRAWKEPYVRDLNIRIRALAAEEGVLLADLEEAFAWDPSYLLDDGLHPNSLGHELMAKTFHEALKDEPSSGGGCTVNPQGSLGLEWIALFLAIFFKLAWGQYSRRYNQHH
ncbi:SGNH/GDSL hydrolase family protein [Desulfonatronum parangueonense]